MYIFLIFNIHECIEYTYTLRNLCFKNIRSEEGFLIFLIFNIHECIEYTYTYKKLVF